MAIAYVGGTSGTSTATASTFTLNYTPTTGNRVVVSLSFGTAGQSSCTVADNNSNSLNSRGGATGVASWIFEYVAVTGATSFKVTDSGHNGLVMCIAEYSGVGSVGQTGLNSTGTSAAAALSATLSNANNWLIGEVNNVATGTVSAGVKASRTGTFSAGTPTGSTTIGGTLVLTASASSNTGTNFLVGSNTTTNATNLAAAIVRNGSGVGVTATSSAAVVTITATTAGTAGNSITLTNFLHFAWAGSTLTGGINSTVLRQSASVTGTSGPNPMSGGLCDTTGSTSATETLTVTSNNWHMRGFEYLPPTGTIIFGRQQRGWGY